MNRKKTLIVLLCLIFAVALAAAVYASVSYGSEDDPLITKSYLDEVLQPKLEEEFEAELSTALQELENNAETQPAEDFVFVSLSSGESLSCGLGCEIMLRSGAAESNGAELVDTTLGEALEEGAALVPNHLYMALGDVSIEAGVDSTGLLIRGEYTLN